MFIAIYKPIFVSMSNLSPLVEILTAFYQSTSLVVIGKEPAVLFNNTEFS